MLVVFLVLGFGGYFLASRFEGVQANPQTPAPKKQGSRVRFRIVIVSSMYLSPYIMPQSLKARASGLLSLPPSSTSALTPPPLSSAHSFFASQRSVVSRAGKRQRIRRSRWRSCPPLKQAHWRKALRSSAYDCIFTDLRVPSIRNGLRASRKVRPSGLR